MKALLITLAVLFSPFLQAQELSLDQQIAVKQGELSALQKQSAASNAPVMFQAIAEMTKASSKCMSDGIESKGFFTRTAAVAKGCREQAMLGAFGICSVAVAQTGGTRDLNQCVAIMKQNGGWQQVWMRGLGIAGALYGGQLASDVVLKGAVPLGLAAINKRPEAPVIVDPVIVNPEIVSPEVIQVQPTIVEQFSPAQ